MYRLSIVFLLVALLFSCSEKTEQKINLIPEKPATAANYWCTWYAQNYWQQRGGEITDFKAINNPNAREELTYHHLYNEKEGWVTNYLPPWQKRLLLFNRPRLANQKERRTNS